MRRWLWRHILHAACQWGCSPLDAPLAGAALLLWGAPSPWPPSWKEGGIVRSPGGHPQTPAKGVIPLWTPRLQGLRFNYGAHLPPGPLPGRKGEIKEEEVMEAHPPYRLPEGLYPSGRPACGSCASIMGRTIPLAPFLEGRGNSKKSWGTPPDPCQRGYTPLDSPLAGAALQLWGAPSPWPPSWKEGGKYRRECMEAHPPFRLPVGLHPSGLPACTHGRFRRTPAIPGFASMVARTIPLAPFLPGRGE